MQLNLQSNPQRKIRQNFRFKDILRFRSSFFLAFVFFYFAFHLVTGERGLLAYVRLKNQMENTRKESQLVQNDKLGLSKKVNGLRDGDLNLDLLEELARKDLGYSKKDEVVLFPDKDKTKQ